MSQFLIPKNVRTRFEFFGGFGWAELFLLLGGLVIGGLIFLLIFIFTKSLYPIVIVGFGGAIGFFLGKPDPRTGKNALDFLKDNRAFNSRPKKYFYHYGGGRES